LTAAVGVIVALPGSLSPQAAAAWMLANVLLVAPGASSGTLAPRRKADDLDEAPCPLDVALTGPDRALIHRTAE
jgi:hypothetical protein